MLQFAEQFLERKIVLTASTQLSWSHFLELLLLKTIEGKLFYAEEAINQNFGVRELREPIEKKDFERKQIANVQIKELEEKIHTLLIEAKERLEQRKLR
jgi:predicted nuclease of restriction endonuclease-like (RecB) superfamily